MYRLRSAAIGHTSKVLGRNLPRLHLQRFPTKGSLDGKLRSFASQTQGDPFSVRDKGTFSAIGVAGGAVGAVVGIGGGNVMVPMMTLSKTALTQHQITATSLVAVVGTGVTSAISYLSIGAVDVASAGLITVAATCTAPIGARLAAQLSAQRLKLYLAVFVLACAPLVPLKGALLSKRAEEDGEARWGGVTDSPPHQGLSGPAAIVIAGTGALAGMASGLLGIGGGVVLTPALALATDLPHLTILGTSLTAMIVPSVMGALVHYRAGTLSLAAGIPLAIGAGVGANIGSHFAARLPEEELRWTFAGVMTIIGAVMLRKAL